MMSAPDLQLVISTYAGLEEILSAELRALGGREIAVHTRAVSCTGDIGFMYKANFSLRTALRVMIRVKNFRVSDGDDIYQGTKSIDWSEYMSADQTFAVRCTLSDDLFDTNLYPALKAKDAIADQFRSEKGKRPDVDKTDPDLEVNLFISKGMCQVLLNSSGISLHQRGYRVDTGKAPLSEVLAAGIVKLSGWEYHKPLVDFMCGSGTIPVEAALSAAQVPPGMFRKSFAFEKWQGFDEALYTLIRDKQLSRISEVKPKIFGNELNRFVYKKAAENVQNAGVEDMVQLSCGDFRDFVPPASGGVVIINPPYGEKLEVEDVQALYKSIGDHLKHHYHGYKAWIFTGSPDGARAIGLRPFRKIKLFNGPIECRLLGFDLYEGKKSDMYRQS